MEMMSAKEALKETWERTTFGDLVRDMRKCDEISQVELACRMGVSKQFLCALENGTKFPSINQAVKVAEALGYDPRPFVEKALEDQLREANQHWEISLKDAS